MRNRFNSRYRTRSLFGTAAAILAFLVVFPGIDIGVWHFLGPLGFWQGLAVVIIALVMFYPQILFAIFMFWIVAEMFNL